MRYGSVCSGMEAAHLAFSPLGWETAWVSEIEPSACALLTHRLPDVPNLGDMTMIPSRIRRGEVEAPAVLIGGTPCQSFSLAGKRESLDDARGNLALTYCEVCDAIDDVRRSDGTGECIAIWENVPGVLSTKDNAFGRFLSQLVGAGCELQHSGARWADSGYVLGPKRAAAWRILDAQYFGLAQRRRRVFVVASARAGVDPAALLFEWESVRRDSPPSRETRKDVAPTISARTSGGGGLGTDFDLDGGLIHFGDEVANLVAFSSKDYAADASGISPTLRAMGHGASHANGGGQVAVAYGFQNAQSGETGKGDAAPCVAVGMVVRRLTPRECDKLQGAMPDWTLVPNKHGKPMADGCRYRMLGNSFAVPCIAWIGKKINAAAQGAPTARDQAPAGRS